MNNDLQQVMNELNQKISARYASKKRYLCLMEDGSIKFLQRQPDDNQTSHMHGWMRLIPCENNAEVLAKALDYCKKSKVKR